VKNLILMLSLILFYFQFCFCAECSPAVKTKATTPRSGIILKSTDSPNFETIDVVFCFGLLPEVSSVISAGLDDYDLQVLGEKPSKDFVVKLEEDEVVCWSRIQITNTGTLTFFSLGSKLDHESTIQFIQRVENFAIRNGATHVDSFLPNSSQYFSLFLSSNLGYKVETGYQDLITGGQILRITKEFSKRNSLLPDCNFSHEQYSGETSVMAEHFMPFLRDNNKKVSAFIRDQETEKILGGCIGSVRSDSIIPHLYITMLWINSKLRGQGFGKNLMDLVEFHAKSHGCKASQLLTNNYQALDFYKKHGYEIETTRPNFFQGPPGTFHNNYLMTKRF
jgi:ribosomal protein S18 acetylase RimI-like enzyme